jgi:uncharacterized metal-binding protein (TIGR02443 family)
LNPNLKKRFIAGAVCPECKQMDTTVINKESIQRECVTCGFQEKMGENKESTAHSSKNSTENIVQWVKR